MTRSKFRKLWLISLGIMMAAAMYSHGKYTETEKSITRKIRQVELLTIERRAGSRLTAALEELNSRTINENLSTRLDILRYLGLEESRLEISISNAVEVRVGKTNVVTRSITIKGNLPYDEALSQLDYFYNTKKIAISYIKVGTSKEPYGDVVSFDLGGTIYGLKKSKKSKK